MNWGENAKTIAIPVTPKRDAKTETARILPTRMVMMGVRDMSISSSVPWTSSPRSDQPIRETQKFQTTIM